MMSTARQPLRVGIVGAGLRGAMYARAFAQCDDVSIAAVTDPIDEAARRLAGEFDARTYPDHGAMAEDASLDVAVIATPDFAHRDAAVEFAERGVTVLVEKPLATSTADAEAIRAAAERTHTRVMPAFENRWNPQYQVIRQQVDDGVIGDIAGQTLSLNDTIDVPRHMLSWAARSTPAWFLLPHALDLALWLCGRRPVAVSAHGTRGVCAAQGIDTWDSVYAHVVLDDATVIALESTWILPAGMPRVFDSHHSIVGTRGVLRVAPSQTGVDRYTDRHDSLGIGYVPRRHAPTAGYPVDMVADLVATLRGQQRDLPSVDDGVIVTRVLDAVHRSLQSGVAETP